jgi:hypothetical protein
MAGNLVGSFPMDDLWVLVIIEDPIAKTRVTQFFLSFSTMIV